MINGFDEEAEVAESGGRGGASGEPIDESFLNNFRAMGTSSRDDLIKQFKTLTNSDISDEHCEFFLDSSSWNLQVALCHYFDTNVHQQQFAGVAEQDQPLALVPDAPQHSPVDQIRPTPLDCDNRIQEIEAYPNQSLQTQWLIRNVSDLPVQGGIHLMPISQGAQSVPVPEPIAPNQTVEVVTNCTVAPDATNDFSMLWYISDSQSSLLSGKLNIFSKHFFKLLNNFFLFFQIH